MTDRPMLATSPSGQGGGMSIAGRLVEATAFDNGVALLRYEIKKG
jgi:hypothetical protein